MFKSLTLRDSALPLTSVRPRAVALARVSTLEQTAEGRSGLDRQRQANASVVKAFDYELVESIEIVDVSGANVFSCPEMRQIVAMAEQRQFQVLIVSELSRLFRPDDLASFASLDVFKRNGILINCGGAIHDLDSPEGFLSSGIMSLLGGYDRKILLRRVHQAKESARLKGLCPSAAITLPLGLSYDRAKHCFEYTPEIAAVQEAFRLIDEDGIRNLSEVGRRVGIHHRTLKNLLGNPYVVGIRAYTKMRDTSVKVMKADGRQKDRPKIARGQEREIRVRIFPTGEQAVTDDRFERVQHFLKEMAERHERFVAPGKGINLLSSIGFCSCCGERLYTATGKRKNADGTKFRGHYLCKSHYYLFKGKMPTCSQGWIQIEKMETVVVAFVSKFLEDPDFVSVVLQHARSKQRSTIVGIDSAPALTRQRLADIEKRDRRLLDAIESGAITLVEVKARRKRLEEEKSGLLRSLRELEDAEKSPDMPKGIIERLASLGPQGWTRITCPRERKKTLSALFLEIYIKGESITAFRLAPGLVAGDSGDWGWVADMPVVLPVSFRLGPEPQPLEVPEDHRKCSRCSEILHVSEFYGKRSGCRACLKAANNARYAAKKSAEPGG